MTEDPKTAARDGIAAPGQPYAQAGDSGDRKSYALLRLSFTG